MYGRLVILKIKLIKISSINLMFREFQLRLKDPKKKLFLIYGFINLLFTNLIVQIFLFIIPIIYATFLSQLFNFLFGFYIYGNKVFKVNHFKSKYLIKYFLLTIFIWTINWLSIDYLNILGYSKNIIALLIVPPLALLSYLSQKYIVFKIK